MSDIDLKIYVDVKTGLFKLQGDQSLVEELLQRLQEAGVESICLSSGGLKNCYDCTHYQESEEKKCSHPEFGSVPWELRDSPRSAVDLEKGCELFQSLQGKAN